MATCEYVSDIKIINNNQEIIFNYLSSFENLQNYLTEENMDKLGEKVPKLKIKDFKSDADSCSFTVDGFGETGLRIVDREAPKNIKITGNGTVPFQFNFWIQLLPVQEYQTKLRLTLRADLNMMMKMMIGNKLKDGINQLADTLTALPYK
ncbi:SRPBCC family protein [Puteibacter caeruleilacunae]|nr:SRPBCC family protein [Puteibacter caeruleilacunae]